MRLSSLLLFSLFIPLAHASDEVVAHYGQQPILRSQLGEDAASAGDKLRELTILPAITTYLREHRSEWMPDEATLARAEAAFQRSRACVPYPTPEYDQPEILRFVVSALIAGTLAEGYIYRNFGGERLLFQQTGVETFDAKFRLAQQLESKGVFRISDPKLRAAAYDYWTRDQSSALLTKADPDSFNPERVFRTCSNDATS